MNKFFLNTILFSTFFTIASSFTVLASSWELVEDNWKYQKDDGSYLSDAWLSENENSYYFGSDGFMLKNTLSPDGYPLTRDGHRIVNREILPFSFPGSEAEFITFHSDFSNYVNGFDREFNKVYDEIYVDVLRVYNSGEYTNARASINRLNDIDFTPYLSSNNIGIRKMSTISEIFRIEQVYYFNEVMKASEQQNLDYYLELLNKISISVDKYYNDADALLSRIMSWDVF